MSKITLNGVDYMGGGGSGGHTIINPSGQNMPSRTGLQFIGASVTDDSVNNKTVVTVTGGGGGVHYSTSEQVIGTWLGKPLYQRTWDFISTNIINANTWTNLFSNDIDIDKITMNETLDDEGRSNKVAYCGVRNGYVAVYSTYTTNIQTITLRYTKSTD